MFWTKKDKKPENKAENLLEMVLGHDGDNWTLTSDFLPTITARELDELDKRLEEALEPVWRERPVQVFMASDNEMIPGWMRPFMNHYFNRILELPLRYSSKN